MRVLWKEQEVWLQLPKAGLYLGEQELGQAAGQGQPDSSKRPEPFPQGRLLPKSSGQTEILHTVVCKSRSTSQPGKGHFRQVTEGSTMSAPLVIGRTDHRTLKSCPWINSTGNSQANLFPQRKPQLHGPLLPGGATCGDGSSDPDCPGRSRVACDSAAEAS